VVSGSLPLSFSFSTASLVRLAKADGFVVAVLADSLAWSLGFGAVELGLLDELGFLCVIISGDGRISTL